MAELEPVDREAEIPSDDYLQQYAIHAVHTVRELGTRFWEWCGHTKESLAQFLSLRQADELDENWIDVDSSMMMRITETPQQHLYEKMESYGTALDEKSDVIQAENESEINEMQDHINALEEKLRESEARLAAVMAQAPSSSHSDEEDDSDDADDEDEEIAVDHEQLEALERDREEFGRQVEELVSEKKALESELESERMEKERLLAEQREKEEEIAQQEMASSPPPDVSELRKQLLASRQESSRLLSLLDAYNGVGLCSKFKTEKEVQELMISIVPNEYTSAIELLESSYQMDPDEDVRPYDVCLKIFANVFRHTKYRQERFFEIIHDNSVFKIDMLVAQKVFWGLIQEHFELLGITPVNEVVEGILDVSSSMVNLDEMDSDVEYEHDEDYAGEEFFDGAKNGHFVGIDCETLEEILNHSIMREYMQKCAEISFFVLWSKTPPLRLRGWKTRPDSEAVFDRNIHERIWGDDNQDNKIRAVVFPALCRIESKDGKDDLVPITKRFVFCSGMVE